ncbi:hypothetical protein [Lewinella sp. IMCC34191]|uniref:hypothetical protein n=1 Tax=Lewinella sp. IMCC34191 TaxID=2259172 RepID=UPI000E253B90|nr:hypothetical protein [Lewinella sp. IMCC34191]
MAYSVFYEDEKGNPIAAFKGEIKIDYFASIHEKQFKVIHYLDPYGDTTFNQLMLKDLLSDLHRIWRQDHRLESLIEFIEKNRGETHTYLKFYGD